MDFRLKIAGMGIAALVLGVVYGKSIETSPRYFGKDDYARYARSDDADEEPDRHSWEGDLPNHYAMVTPSGRIEVDELSYYVRNRSDWAAYARYSEPLFLPEPDWQWDESDSASSFAQTDRFEIAPQPSFREARQPGHEERSERVSEGMSTVNLENGPGVQVQPASTPGKLHLVAPVMMSDGSD